MDLQTRLTEDMKAALKSGQKDRLSVIRMVLSDVKNIDLMPSKPTAEQVVEAYAKKLRKSVEEYERIGRSEEVAKRKGEIAVVEEYERIGRSEEVAKLKGEIAVVEEYLPKKASAADTERLVDEFLAKHPFTEKQFGQAMGQFMKAHGAQVDPGQANQLLKKNLA